MFFGMIGLLSAACALADVPDETNFACANWANAKSQQSLSGSLQARPDGASLGTLEYSIQLRQDPSQSLADRRVNLNLPLRRDSDVNAPMAIYRYQVQSEDRPGDLSIDLEGFATDLIQKVALPVLTELTLVFQATPAETSASGAVAPRSMAKFRIHRFNGQYLDLLSVWNCEKQNAAGGLR